MEVTDRVQVVAHGWEIARVVEPIYELKADTVVLILPKDEEYVADFEHEMISDLQSTDRLHVEIREARLYDLDSALQAFTQAVKDHEDDDVYINVSSGTQIAGIAGMMAAQTSDAVPFFVQHTPADPGADEVPTPDEPVIEHAGPIAELPVFELDGPSTEQLRILGFLYGMEGATKKELIAFAEDEQLPFIADTEAESTEGRYRLLESHVIDPLTDGGYVAVEKVGREKVVSISDRGIDALAAFPLDTETVVAAGDEGDHHFPSLTPSDEPTPWSDRDPPDGSSDNSTPFSDRKPE
jgi:hypothetical protein